MAARGPSETGAAWAPAASGAAGSTLAVVVSVLLHVGLAFVVPEMRSFEALGTVEPAWMELAAVLPPAPSRDPVPSTEPEPDPEPEPRRERRPREVVVRWERLPEPPEPQPAAEGPEDDLDEPAGDPNARPDARDAEGVAQATVSSVEGGLEVGVPGGPGSDGATRGTLRAGGGGRNPGTMGTPLGIDRRMLTAWMRRVRRDMGQAESTLALRRTGLTGLVKVAFEIAPDGRVLSVRVRESGGHALLDEAALEFARSVRRVEPPPAELHWSELPARRRRITLPIRYGG